MFHGGIYFPPGPLVIYVSFVFFTCKINALTVRQQERDCHCLWSIGFNGFYTTKSPIIVLSIFVIYQEIVVALGLILGWHINNKLIFRTVISVFIYALALGQRAGLELMDMMAVYQEGAYERLCRWSSTLIQKIFLSSTCDNGHTIYHNIRVKFVSFDHLLKALIISIIEL